ncbi:MAG: M20/M25/M40 family metallo-hydrolase [Thermoanaerobaculia bacterium]
MRSNPTSSSSAIHDRRRSAAPWILGLALLGAASFPAAGRSAGMLHDPREVHLQGVRQLTFGGENAEAYWAENGRELIFQSTRPPYACDQIFTLAVDPAVTAPEPRLVSTGAGKTTCSYFTPDGEGILYASTHGAAAACPPPPDRSHGYVWAIDSTYEIYRARRDGSEPVALTRNEAYDAEATTCPLDGTILFTSTRDGDLDLYRMNPDGSEVQRLTNTPGYDGGAYFSRDCRQIVWRASRPRGTELDDFRDLLGKSLVRPGRLELWVADIEKDGLKNARQITDLGAASFAPYFFPDGRRVIFSSNYGDPKGREFDLWAIHVDGSGLERITFAPGFDGFPMFSPDGTRLAFASNRNQGKPGETDVYVADWISGTAATTEVRAADRYLRDAAWLADDARQGRGVGTPGLEASAVEIERLFREIGLEPAGENGTFRQNFDVTVALTAGTATSLAIDGEKVAADDFRPLPFSKSAAVSAPVVFAGYGVTTTEPARDDYEGLDVAGKVVLVRRFVPAGFDGEAERRFSELRYKLWNAREHGAVGILIADLPEAVEGKPLPDEARLPGLHAEDAGDAGIVAAAVSRAVAESLVSGSHRAALTVELIAERRSASNVAGLLRGTAATDGKRARVLLGAHYDHLGLGGASSLAPGIEEIHNGADDNASGVAALLEAARELAARRSELGGEIEFVAFAGEERGLLGSTAFVRNPPAGLALTDLRAMVNMDMVGRLRDNELALLGGGSAVEWPEIVAPVCERRGLECKVSGDGYGPSDQTAFYAAGVPVLHLFTGTHDDYHKPSDDAERINAVGGAAVAAVAAGIATAVVDRAAPLTYASAPQPAPRGDARSFGASLGTIPDYAGPGEGIAGVLLAGTRPGGPAERAGLARGDLLVELAGKEIRDINDMMFVLRSAHPGDKATAVVVRDGKRLELPIVFGESRRM